MALDTETESSSGKPAIMLRLLPNEAFAGGKKAKRNLDVCACVFLRACCHFLSEVLI